MKHLINTTIHLLAGAVLALASSLSGVAQSPDGPVKFVSDPASGSVTVNGSSSLHDWSVDGEEIRGEVVFQNEVPESLVKGSEVTFELKTAGVRIPVRSLTSEKDGLNEKMYSAMEADQYPHVKYRLTSATFDSRPTSNKVRLQTEGELTVSGETRTLEMPILVTRKSSGRLVAEGETDLKMTNFGIERPTALGGLVTAYDKVTVNWKWAAIRQVSPRYSVGSIMRETTSVFLERYGSARSALAEGNLDRALRSLQQIARGAKKIKLSFTNLSDDEQSEAQPLIDQFRNTVDQATEAEDLETLREQFKNVSRTLRKLVAAFGHERAEPIRYIQCAAGDGSDRRWLGDSKNTDCPYLPEDQRAEPDGFAIQLLIGSDTE